MRQALTTRARAGALLAGLMMLTTLTAVASESSGAAWSPPTFVRSVGGRGEAGVYSWGITYNPVSDEILVGDYWNYKVRRYDRLGNELGAFYRPPNVRKGQPYSLAVNPLNGDIYVPEISDGKETGYIARYDKAGSYLGAIRVGADYIAWIYIDAAARLWIADSHYWNDSGDPPKVRQYDLATGNQISSFGTYGTGSGRILNIHGLGRDAAGLIYTADAGSRTVHVYTSSGTWVRDFGSEGTGLGQFTGDLRGLAVDPVNGWVYVVDAAASEIEKFALDGTPLAHWGSEGSGPGQYGDGGRQLTVDPAGHVWVADYGNFRFHEYDSDGVLLGTFPDPARPPTPGGFSQNRDVAVDAAANLWVADAWNNRFQKFAPDGTFLGTWGTRNSHAPYGMDYPRGIGVDPATGNIWVADTRDHIIRVYASDASYIMTVGDGEDSSGTGSFRWPMDVEFFAGKAYISDYTSGRVKILNAATGAELSSFSQTNNGVAVDPATGNIYVVSWSRDRVYRYSPSGSSKTLEFGSTGSGNGQFQNPWDIDIVNSVLYVTDAQLGRIQAFDLSGTYLGQWGTKGVGTNQFNNPSGITHDAAGNIYVADAGNNRVQVFSPSAAPPSGDVTKPTATVTAPTKNQTVPAATVMISGQTADDIGIARVEVAVRNVVTGLWWNANDAVWQTGKAWNLAPWSGPSTTPSFAIGFIGTQYGGSYQTQARATDTAGNFKVSGALVPFFVDGGGIATDTTPPTTTIVTPANGGHVAAGTVAVGGQIIDDVAANTAEIGIKDRTTNLWWDPATSTWGAFRWIPVTVVAPGAPTSAWSYVWDGAIAGQYFIQARAFDSSNNITGTPLPSTKFIVNP